VQRLVFELIVTKKCEGKSHIFKIEDTTWKAIERMNFKGRLVKALIKALQTEEATMSLVVPRLQGLLLVNVDFESHLILESLRDCLMSQCDFDLGVTELHLHNCKSISPNNLQLLREIIVDLCLLGRPQEAKPRRRANEQNARAKTQESSTQSANSAKRSRNT
jgi:hypothetical protein